MNTQIQAYIEQDTEKVADLIAAYPQNIPVHALAKFLHCTPESVRWRQPILSALRGGRLAV